MDKNFTPEGLDSKVAVLYDSKVKDTKELIEKVSIIRNQNQKVLVLEKAKNMTKQLNDLLDQGVSKFASFRESQELEFKELKK